MNVQLLKDAKAHIYIAATGGGLDLLGSVANEYGLSDILSGATFPYSRQDFIAFIGNNNFKDKFSSIYASRALALEAYKRAYLSVPTTFTPIGVGLACSLASVNERVGRKHKIYITIHSEYLSMEYSLILSQGRSRETENGIIRNIIDYLLNLFLIKLPQSQRVPLPVNLKLNLHTNEEQKLEFKYKSDTDFVFKAFDIKENQIISIIPGSFNPLQRMHLQMYFNEKLADNFPVFELTKNNADKKSTTYVDLCNRVNALNEYNKIISTDILFVDKFVSLRNIYPKNHICFVIGSDTFLRVMDTKYGYSKEQLHTAFDYKNNNVSFKIYLRDLNHKNEIFDVMKDMDKIDYIFESDEINTISSTELRNNEE